MTQYKIQRKRWCMFAMVSTLLALFTFSNHANAQQKRSQPRLPGTVKLGPRLLEYRIECNDSTTCRIQCFQNGTIIFERGRISKTDQVRLFASTSTGDEVIPRWIEIRSTANRNSQTVLLSEHTACDLRSLTISPTARP